MKSLLLLLTSLVACNTADLQRAPPTANVRPCVNAPVVFCDAMPPGADGCLGDPSSGDPGVRQFPIDASFPVGCAANVILGRDIDTCVVSESCRCVAPDAGDAGPRWACSP